MKYAGQRIHDKGSMREMLAITLPMIVSQSCDTIMIFTDRLFLSRLGPEFMSAALGGGLTAFMIATFFIGLTSYTTALVAQYLGAGQKKQCAVVVTQALIFSVIAYPFILLCIPLAHGLFTFMHVSPEQMKPQILYFNILIYGAIINLLRNSLSCFFSGIGRTRIVMIASFTALIINVILNYILIYGKCGFPALGIRGSAYGTIIGSACGLLVLAGAYFSRRNVIEFRIPAAFRFDQMVAKKLLRFGSPAGAEMFLNILGFNVIVMTFHGHSAITATAATIMFNWDLVAFVPLIGIEIGVTSLVGRYMGAGDPDTAHKATMEGLKLGLLYSLGILIMFVGWTHGLVALFKPSVTTSLYTEAVPLALFMLRMAALYVLVDAMIVAFIGALRGAGDTLWAMALTVGLHWVAAIAAFVCMRGFHLSPELGWSIIVVTFVVFSFIIYWRYQHGSWKNIRLVHPESTIRPGYGMTDDLC